MKWIHDLLHNYILNAYNNLSEHEYRTLSVSVLIFMQSIFIGLFFIPIQFKAGGEPLAIYAIVLFLIAILCITLVKYFNMPTLAKILFIVACNTLIYMNSSAAGLEAGVQYFLAPSVALPFLMFDQQKNKSLIIFSFTFSLLLGGIVHIDQLRIVEQLHISRNFIKFFSLSSGATSLLLIATSVYYFQNIVRLRDEELLNKNALMVQSEKLASLGTMSSGIAHEINSPLTVILGTATQLKRDLHKEQFIKEECEIKINRIIKMTERISQIVRSLKTFNRNESNLPLVSISLQSVYEETKTLINNELIQFSIDLSSEIDPLIHVYSRESELLQVFINLSSNAAYAIQNLETPKWIKIKTEVIDHKVHIYFIDSGKGIKKELVAKIFDPFFTSKKVGEGTGLGLYICRNITETMNGKLDYIEDQPNTTFRIILDQA